MTRVSATEFKNNIGAYSDAAMSEPVIITSHQRDRLVLLSAEDYKRLIGDEGDVSPELKELADRIIDKHRKTIIDLANR